ncbi:MAG: hypothetical protein LCH58_08980 [Bacteroidetes bacterium]|uniref:hypothetical protein n=1 Tax=Phnomibacter sp. TaxID=2836217 RepID=UPI002FDE7D3C|nr:hypothetical protein [Bacteroidota bacterium]
MRLLVTTLCIGWLLAGHTAAHGQLTTLINPLAEGGFEAPGGLAANGWTAINSGQVHGWAAHTGVADATGTRAAFMTSNYQNANPAVALNVAAGTASISHFFRDVTLPVNAGNIVLAFKYRSNYAVANPSANPPLRVYLASSFTAGTFTAGALPSGVTTAAVAISSVMQNWQRVVVQLSPSLAGQTIRLAFTSSIPASVATSNPFGMQIDSVALTARAGGASVTNVNSTGKWADPANWSGGYIPGPADQVTIAQGTTVTLSGSGALAGQLTLAQNATLNASTGIELSGSLLVNNGATLSAPNSNIVLQGNFTLQSGASANLQAATLNFANAAGTAAQTFNFVSPSQFTNGRLAAIEVNNPQGVSIPGSPGTISVYSRINLVRGTFTHNNNIMLNHAAASSSAPPIIFSIQTGRLSAFPPADPNNNLELRYVQIAGAGYDTTYVMGAANELPANRTISRLTVGSARSVVEVNDSLFVTDNNANTLFLFGIVKVAPGKAIVCTNNTYGGATGSSIANQGHIQGAVVFTINGTSIAERMFPVGSGGSRRIFSLRGITAINARVAVECVPAAGGTLGAGLTALGETHRWYARLVSGTLTSVDSVDVQASTAEGFAAGSEAQRRISRSATLAGTYNNVGNTLGSFVSPLGAIGEIVRTTAGNYNTLGYFAPALTAGNFLKTWTGNAGTNNWSDAANWSGGTLPSCNSDVSISKPFSPIFITGISVCGNLQLNNSSIIEVKSGGRLTLGCSTGSGKQIQFNGAFNKIEVQTGGEVRVQ